MNVVFVFVTSSILFILLAILVVLFVLSHQKRMLKQQYDLQELKHNREIELMQATIDAQEREQNRIGKDLHDDLGALLTASKIQLQQIKRLSGTETPTAPYIELGAEMLDQSIDRLRAIAKSLSPPTLEHFGIKDALEEYAIQFSSAKSIQINTSIKEKRYDSATELGLFRMIQELVNNTMKYAQATKIDISLTTDQDFIWLHYSDNGIGFDVETVKKGLGLRNLEGRSTKLGGTFTIQKNDQPGFQCIIQLPNNERITTNHGTED